MNDEVANGTNNARPNSHAIFILAEVHTWRVPLARMGIVVRTICKRVWYYWMGRPPMGGGRRAHSMSKRLELDVTSCRMCPFSTFDSYGQNLHCGSSAVADGELKLIGEWEDESMTIPDWCPLPDTEEEEA